MHPNTYTEINPYETMYRNMNIHIHQHINKETAELVVRQLGYMHNAFGLVVKDFVKILSYKFTDPLIDQQLHSFTKPASSKNHQEPMDIQEQKPPYETAERKKNVFKEDRLVENQTLKKSKAEGKLSKKSAKNQERAPISNSNFFQEFAFQNNLEDEKQKKLAKLIEVSAKKHLKQNQRMSEDLLKNDQIEKNLAIEAQKPLQNNFEEEPNKLKDQSEINMFEKKEQMPENELKSLSQPILENQDESFAFLGPYSYGNGNQSKELRKSKSKKPNIVYEIID